MIDQWMLHSLRTNPSYSPTAVDWIIVLIPFSVLVCLIGWEIFKDD